MNRIISCSTFVLLICLLVGSVQAGIISEQLRDKLAETDKDEFVRVVIIPEDDFDALLFKYQMEAQYKTRDERYRAGAAILQGRAERIQQPIIEELQPLIKAGDVTDVKGYWTSNVLVAWVKKSEVEAVASHPLIANLDVLPKIGGLDIPSSEGSVKTGFTPEANLEYVNADQCWDSSYDGSGRIVCIFDSGVDGLHEAFEDN